MLIPHKNRLAGRLLSESFSPLTQGWDAINLMKTKLALYAFMLGCLVASAPLAQAQTTVTISATDSELAETRTGQTPNPAKVRVSRTGSTTSALAVWVKVGGTAVRNSDYSFGSTVGASVTIPAGSAHLDISVNALDDAAVEVDEVIRVELEEETSASLPVPYDIGAYDRAEIDLFDNDSLPSPAVIDVEVLASASEGIGEPPVAGVFRITRSGDLSAALTVAYSVSGSANSGADFAALSGSVAIPAGATFADVTVTPVDDAELEGDEFVSLTILPSTCASVHPLPASCYAFGASTTAELSIEDNEIPPVRAVVEVAALNNAAEDSGGSPVAGTFRFTRSENLDVALVVDYSIDGTAESGADYAVLSGSVAIPAGVASVDVVVSPVNDSTVEDDENVLLTIVPPSCPEMFPAATCYLAGASASASVTITSEDVPPVRAVVNVAALNNAAENSGGSPAVGTFRFTRSANLDVALTVAYSVSGTATSVTDYATLLGSVAIPAGVASVDVTVSPVDDTNLETSETVVLTISPSTCPELYPAAECYLVGAAGAASLTILDNEIAPVVAATISQNTNFAGIPAVGQGSFTAHSTNGHIAAYQIRVDGAQQIYHVINHPTPPAPGTPFTADFALTNLPAGNRNVQVTVYDNFGNAATATNSLAISNIPMPSVFQAVAIDDDASETLPGETPNTGRVRFTMTGDFNIGIWDWGFGGTARINSDYTLTWDGGTLTTNGNVLTWTTDAVVAPIDDQIVEPTETMDLQACFVIIAWIYGVGAPIGTECSSFGAPIFIRDNDTASPYPVVRVTAGDADAQEVSTYSGDAQNPGAFTITRTAPATNDLPVFFTLTGTAQNGTDYSSIVGTATIPQGTTSTTVTVNPVFDVLLEGSETVTLTLRPPVAAPTYLLDPGSINSATVTIRDYAPTNTPVVRIKVTDALAYEQPAISPHASFRIERSGNLTAPFTLDYAVSGTASNGVDYVALPGVANFASGAWAANLTVIPYIDGETNEPDETVIITLARPAVDVFPPPYLLGGTGTMLGTAAATIREDAPPVTRPLDRFERARRLRFPGRYRLVPLPTLPVVTVASTPAVPGDTNTLVTTVTWAVEASSDFKTWEEIGVTEDPEEFVDVSPTDAPQRFYRFRQVLPDAQ